MDNDKKLLIKKAKSDLKKINDKKKLLFNDELPSEVDSKIEDITSLKEEFLKKDAKLFIEVSDDKLKAFLTIIPSEHGGNDISEMDVLTAIQDKNISNNIDNDAINDSVNKSRNGEKVIKTIFAKGIKAEPAIKRKIVYLFKKEDKKEDENNKIDFKEFYRHYNVAKDEAILEIFPAKPGKNGIDVFGNEIASEIIDDVEFKFGENVRTQESEDKIIVFSCIDGKIVLEDNFIEVEPVFEVPGDVDLSVGNIYFTGDVLIHGSILDDFTVSSTGNITVEKNIYAAFVASNNNIIVKGGIIGRNRGVVKALGNISAGFAENANIKSSKCIKIIDASVQSQLSAKRIDVSGKRGTIVGGNIFAESELNCKQLGSSFGVNTSVTAGNNLEILNKIKENAERYEFIKSSMAKLQEYLKPFSDMLANDELSEDEKNMLLDYVRELKSFKLESKKLGQELIDLKKASKVDENTKIIVMNKIYPGVKITIGNRHHEIKKELFSKIFFWDKSNDEIIINPYTRGKNE